MLSDNIVDTPLVARVQLSVRLLSRLKIFLDFLSTVKRMPGNLGHICLMYLLIITIIKTTFVHIRIALDAILTWQLLNSITFKFKVYLIRIFINYDRQQIQTAD